MLLAITNPEWCLVIAIALFIAGAILAGVVKAYYAVCIAVGLVLFAAAFIVDPQSMRVNIRKTHPTLYRMIMAVAVWQVLLAFNYWRYTPTFTPLGIDPNIVGAVFLVLGVTQLACLNVVRDLRAINATMAVSIFCMCSWALLNTEQAFEGRASFALPLAFGVIAVWQVLQLIESPVNPMTRKATT